ncbi:M15 family metallopeptidase [Mycolicibacterium goodii]|uniref:Peptidase M15 n=1 Tax=Mycolicibacterium goodii TaxID=134601 RepID=A0A0K0X2I8_MYCGD|nr:peptidase M15 [Mycolicibacterium goodii]
MPAAILAAAVVLNALLIGVLAHQSPAPAAAAAHRSFIDLAPEDLPASKVTIGDGAVPEGVTVFDDEIPAVANLDDDLLAALRRAATEAGADQVGFVVNSGWRSPKYQDQLLREAFVEYGSETEAARWVATPDTSAHVSGDAVDIGPSDAAAWLSANGAAHGLCQIYGNEPWHFELRPDAVEHGCPPLYADPTQDPRMRQ